MTVILVTGVSDGANREPDRLRLEQYLGVPVVLFDPEKYMKKPLLAKAAKLLGLSKAYDVLDYILFHLAAPEVDYHFDRMMHKYQPESVWGHSFGSAVAASWLCRRDNTLRELITVGSPLWMSVWPMVQLNKVNQRVRKWSNYWSSRDWIARFPIKQARNIRTLSPHEFKEYLERITP